MNSQSRYLLLHKSISGLSFSSTNYSPKRLFRLLDWLISTGQINDTVLTFDDGYEHLVDVLPLIIEKYQIPIIVFVPTAFIGKPASWDYSYYFRKIDHLQRRSIKSLSSMGVKFGSHGHTHSDLSSLSQKKLDSELRQSREILSEITGQPVKLISYPFGRINQRVLRTSAEFGFELGFTSKFPNNNDIQMAQGRVPIHSFDTKLTAKMKLGEGFFNTLEAVKSRITNGLSGGTVILNHLRRLN